MYTLELWELKTATIIASISCATVGEAQQEAERSTADVAAIRNSKGKVVMNGGRGTESSPNWHWHTPVGAPWR
jgi:hypothetical protein